MTFQPNKKTSLNEHVRAKHSKVKEYIVIVSRQLDLIFPVDIVWLHGVWLLKSSGTDSCVAKD